MDKRTNKNEIVGQVYMTRDYEKFKKLIGNRKVLDKRVARIKKSIAAIGLIPSPIIVNEKYEIADGQGRFYACRELGLPVYYTIVKGIGLKECTHLNQGQTNWKPIDWIELYAAQGNENYIRFLDILNRHPKLSLQVVYGVATNSINTGGAGTKMLKEGRLNINSEWAETITHSLNFLEELSEELRTVKGEQRILQTALAWVINNTKVNARRLQKIVSTKYPLIQSVVNVDIFLNDLSDLYNKGLSADKCIYFNTEYKQALRKKTGDDEL